MLTYESDTFQLLAEPWPMPRGYGSGAVFWGNNGIAFHDGKRLYLTEGAAIPSGIGNADLQLTASATGPAVAVAADHEMSARLKNIGPTAAQSVSIRMSGGADLLFTGGSVERKNAIFTQLDRAMTLGFDSLSVGEEVEIRFTAQSAVAAWQPISILATSSDLDMNGADNSALVVLKAQPPPSLDSQVLLRLGATAMVADRARGKLIVAPGSSAAPLGNSIVTIDPTTGDLTQPLWVGSRPSELAISDDGKSLFVGFIGIPEVRRFTLPDLRHDLTIPMGANGFSGPRFPTDIAVRPGHPSEIAVARATGTSGSLQRDQFGYFHDATDLLPDRGEPILLRFIDADRVLTYDSFGIVHWFDVTDQSITWKAIVRDVSPGDAQGVVYHDGKLHFNDGSVYEATTGIRVGRFSFFGPYAPGPIIDAASNRGLVVTRGVNEQLISAYDVSALTQTGFLSVAGNLGALNGFVRWSGDGLALSGSGGVAILNTDLFGRPPDELKISELALGADTLTLRFSKLSPGFYAVIESASLDGEWAVVGEALFRETTTEISVPVSSQQKFYRLARFQ